MSKEMRDLCLFMGSLGLAYAMLLVLAALFTGAKIVKGVVIIASLSTMLFTIGLSPQVKTRIKAYAKSVVAK
ncbi:MAG: hypothetical protein ACI8WB_002408 [Phenylobacterium sp.]|jgi:hypothetical protein